MSIMKKRFLQLLFLAAVVYGAAELLGSLVAWILCRTVTAPGFFVGEAASIGIFGGADGPTAVFVGTPGWTGYVVPVLCLVAGIWGFVRLRKENGKRGKDEA